MPDGRQLGEDLLDVGKEAEIEHLVGLVEDDLGGTRQVEQTLIVQVDQTARRTDDDLRAGLELIDLPFVGLAAVDRDDAGRATLGQHVHVFVDLDGQFARRNDDEGLDARFGVQTQPLDNGDAEAERLAGTGLGLTDDVLAGKTQRDRLLLDRESIHDAFVGEDIDDVLIDAEIGESRHCIRACLAVRGRPGVVSTPFTHPQARGLDPTPRRNQPSRASTCGP